MAAVLHRTTEYRVVRQDARLGKIEKYDGGDAGTNVGGASEIPEFRQHPEQTITLTASDDMSQCVHIFNEEPTCNKEH